MGCNCNKGGGSSSRRQRTLRPRVVQQTNNTTPQQLRALGFQGGVQSQQNASSGQLDAERRRIEKIRRQAIRKKLVK